MTFGNWPEGAHDSPDQLKRLASAKSSKTTPTSIDAVSSRGIFPGSGAMPYNVTLESCTCGDFIRRGLPCKHMYRLAIELGLLNEKAEFGVNKNTLKASQISLEKAVSILESLGEDAQKIIKDIIYETTYHKEIEVPIKTCAASDELLCCPLVESSDNPVIALQALKRNEIVRILDALGIAGFKRNSSLKNLSSWCVENIPDVRDIFPKIYVFRLSEQFESARRRVYTYLLRKFDWEIYVDEDMKEIQYPHGARFGDVMITTSIDGNVQQGGNLNVCYFPDDEVTRLLTQYGYNRCLGGFDVSAQND